MAGKDKVVMSCILFKNDVVLLKRYCEECNISFSNLVREIVHVYSNVLLNFPLSFIDTSPFNDKSMLIGDPSNE